MNNNHRCFNTFIRLSIMLCLISATAAAKTSPDKQASQILDATGVKGGLIVHLNCGDGKLTAALRTNQSFLVHGLDTDPADVEKAREHIRNADLYGKVTAETWTGNALPYADNLVNLVVSDEPLSVGADELMRVLAPNGVAYIKNAGKWTKTVKPRPDNIDEWTHFLRDASGNAVARDTVVGPPKRMQWVAEPSWIRSHHTLASISAIVSANGRIFYIIDSGSLASIEAPPVWSLVARDAFNGILLWERPIPNWAWHRRKFRSGPVQLPRILVAEDDRVYVPLGLEAPLTALDAATGKVARAYKGADGTEEIILSDGVLVIVTGSPASEQSVGHPAQTEKSPFPNEKAVVAYRADTGKQLWKWSEPDSKNLMPLTLAAANGRVFFAVDNGLLCLDSKTGDQIWSSAQHTAQQSANAQKGRSGNKGKPQRRSPGWSVATLVVHDDVVLWTNGKRLEAISAKTGKPMWSCPCQAGFKSSTDIFVTAGLVWLGPNFGEGRDLHTGEIKTTNTVTKDLWTVGHHHRCYREKATENYILTGKRGIEFLDLKAGNHSRNNWIRGLCQYGIMPCNGLIYAPSHACSCFMEAKLYGFWALAPAAPKRKALPAAPQLQKGPAFGRIAKTTQNPNDWPTQRHDALRSGTTTMQLPAKLENIWNAELGGKLTAPVAAGGSVVVASVNGHRVFALDSRSGKTRWSFSAGGRIDSAPTIYKGTVLFGSADGYIYSLRLSDGKLAWRFRAAPRDLRTVALDQIESLWPVHGSILIHNDLAYAAAGRSSYLDGGITLYGLDPMTGKVVHRSRIRSEDAGIQKDIPADAQAMAGRISQNATDFKTFTAPDKSDAFSMEGTTSDILVSDGEAIFMRHLKFDEKCVRQPKLTRHLFSTSALVDDNESHRSHWVLGTGDFSRVPVAYSWIAYGSGRYGYRLGVPYGLMLSFDDDAVWGVRRSRDGKYTLFADDNTPLGGKDDSLPDFRKATKQNAPSFTWTVDLAVHPQAMLRAGKTLLVAGVANPNAAPGPSATNYYDPAKEGILLAASAADGGTIFEHKLEAPPVWDGMAAAEGRLYIATRNGSVVCLGKQVRSLER